MSDRIVKFAAAVFLGQVKPTEDELQDLLDRLQDFPRYRDLTIKEVELLEKNPRALGGKLLEQFLMGTQNSNKTLQTFAREVLDDRQEQQPRRAFLPPLEPLEVPDEDQETLNMVGNPTSLRVRLVSNGLGPYQARIPSFLFNKAMETISQSFLIRVGVQGLGPIFLRPVGTTSSEYNIELDEKKWSDLQDQFASVNMVTGLKTVQFVNLDINLHEGQDVSPYRPQVEEALQDLPTLSLGQRIVVDPEMGLEIMVTQMLPEHERVLQMPLVNSEIVYNIRNRKYTPMMLGKCLGCHQQGKVAFVERGALHRTFCGKECQQLHYL